MPVVTIQTCIFYLIRFFYFKPFNMKILFTSIAFLLIQLSVVAQQIIENGSKLPAIGTTASVQYASTSQGMGSSGNIVADFSNLTFTETGTLNIIDPVTSPYYIAFQNSNFAYTISPLSGTARYHYFNASSGKFEILATDYTGPNTGKNYRFNSYQYLSFPFNVNQGFTDTYQLSGEALQTFTGTYDAFGSLVLPDITYENVARIKLDNSGAVKYVFWSLNPLFPILSYNNGVINYYELAITTGVNEERSENYAFNIFPNPASDRLFINISDKSQADSFELINNMGNTVFENELKTAGVTDIGINRLSPGIYLYNLKLNGVIKRSGRLSISY